MSMHILAIDQGTTSSRAIIFNQKGEIVSKAQQEFQQRYPQSGWVEHDPEEIWQSQSTVVNKALIDAHLSAKNIAAVGITNQRETTVIWDRKTGKPIANAIVWQDRRTSDEIDKLKNAGYQELFLQKTGLILDAYFSASKIKWLLDNIPDTRKRAENGELAFGTVDSWLTFKATNGKLHITDYSNASRTLLFNIHTGEWDDELLKIFDTPKSILPSVCSSSEVYGEITAWDALRGVPIGGILGDQQAATIGQVCTKPGLGKSTYGTGCFLMMNTGDAKTSHHKLLSTILWNIAGQSTYGLEGSVFIGGAIVQWLRDGLGFAESTTEIQRLSETVSDSDGVMMVPALSGLGAPHWDQYARGMIIGMTRRTTKAHIARAAIESIAYSVTDLISAMQRDSGVSLNELRVDGGATVNETLLQFQADLLQIPIVRPTVLETTALGAAYVAGLAVDYWSSFDEIEVNWKKDKHFEPKQSASEVQRNIEKWRDAVQRSKSWEQV